MTAVAVAQLRLVDVPMAGLYPVSLADANGLLVEWQHKLGPVNRPFRSEGYVLEAQGRPVAVAVSASLVSDVITGTDRRDRKVGWRRDEAVELARLAGEPWATRVMIRLWREVCGPLWGSWPVKIAVSYSHNAMHKGDLYRFDGWEKIRSDAGSPGGGTWSRKREAREVLLGLKSLWIWRYDIGSVEGGTGPAPESEARRSWVMSPNKPGSPSTEPMTALNKQAITADTHLKGNESK